VTKLFCISIRDGVALSFFDGLANINTKLVEIRATTAIIAPILTGGCTTNWSIIIDNYNTDMHQIVIVFTYRYVLLIFLGFNVFSASCGWTNTVFHHLLSSLQPYRSHCTTHVSKSEHSPNYVCGTNMASASVILMEAFLGTFKVIDFSCSSSYKMPVTIVCKMLNVFPFYVTFLWVFVTEQPLLEALSKERVGCVCLVLVVFFPR